MDTVQRYERPTTDHTVYQLKYQQSTMTNYK